MTSFSFGPDSVEAARQKREKFLRDIQARPPRVIIVTDRLFPSGPDNYQKLSLWPRFDALLRDDYFVYVQRIRARRSAGGAGLKCLPGTGSICTSRDRHGPLSRVASGLAWRREVDLAGMLRLQWKALTVGSGAERGIAACLLRGLPRRTHRGCPPPPSGSEYFLRGASHWR